MKRFLILDGYPKEDRDKFDEVGMTHAGKLYLEMLSRYVDNPMAEIVYTSDSKDDLTKDFIKSFDAILWPGCSLTVYEDDWRAKKMLKIADLGFDTGLPQFGSCWAAQVAVHLVGGKVSPHPDGEKLVLQEEFKERLKEKSTQFMLENRIYLKLLVVMTTLSNTFQIILRLLSQTMIGVIFSQLSLIIKMANSGQRSITQNTILRKRPNFY